MKNIILILGLILFIGSAVHADSNLDEIQLNWQNGEVILKIFADGPYQYTHEIAEAKDGKPFRVLVDLFPSIHNLHKKQFTDIPSTVISDIRTSQYSVKPTATSRVVLDLKRAVAYRIEKKGNWIFVYIPDPNCPSFPVWSSNDFKPVTNNQESQPKVAVKTESVVKAEPKVKAESTAQKPVTTIAKVDEKKAPATQAPKPAAAVKPETPKATEEPKSFKQEYSYNKPESSFAENWRSIEPETVWEEPAREEKSEPKPAPKKTEQPIQLAITPEPVKTVAKTETEPVEVKKSVEKKTTEAVNSPQKEDTEVTEPAKKKTDDANKSDVDQKLKKVKKSNTVENAKTDQPKDKQAPVVAQKPAEDNKKTAEETKRPTSRFRRQPEFSNKMKGTIVAEFPKRLVIKYQSGNPRDPFASLIDADKKGDDKPNGQKIPDVETSRLVGVLESADGNNRALLEDVDGYGYILKSGDKVKKGYVSKIYPQKALFQLFEYGWSRTVALRLNQN